MAAAGIVENNGVPVDAALRSQLVENWDCIKRELIRVVDQDFGVYENGKFVQAKFAAYLGSGPINFLADHSIH